MALHEIRSLPDVKRQNAARRPSRMIVGHCQIEDYTMYTSETRRRVLKVVLALPVLATANLGRNALAEDLPALEESDPTAKALGYTTDASTVDTKKYPAFQAGSHCANCTHFQGASDASTGPCAIFAGKSVVANGWCSAWVKKA